MKYIIDSRYFNGIYLTTMHNNIHSDYGGETLEQLREREKNPHLIAVSPERIALLVKRYKRALYHQPFREITEKRYYDLLQCLPLARIKNNWLFVEEPYYDDLYPFFFRSQGKFFHGERPIRLSDVELSRQIQKHMKTVNQRPALIKGEPFIKYVHWYNKEVTYIPYHFEYEGKRHFLMNLATKTTEIEYRASRRNMAERLANLRRHHYQYCTFYSKKEDIFEFFEWLRKNKYTLEVHGKLFNFSTDRSYVDFGGNVCEYSAAFHYRIYSRELFEHIINQLRTVKRHHAWRRNTGEQCR